jgi:hypothetical protein
MEAFYWVGVGILLGMALTWYMMTRGGDQGEQ